MFSFIAIVHLLIWKVTSSCVLPLHDNLCAGKEEEAAWENRGGENGVETSAARCGYADCPDRSVDVRLIRHP
jgi:hypothetical protein